MSRELNSTSGVERGVVAMRILILDQKQEYGALLGDLLELSCVSEDVQIFHAQTLEEAIFSISSLNIYFVVVQPEASHTQEMRLIKVIKNHKPAIHVLAVHMSADNPCFPGCRARCLLDGATWHFESPREVNEVIRVIKFCVHFNV